MIRTRRFRLIGSLSVLAQSMLLISCNPQTENSAVLWTNQDSFASYVELFNTSQNKHTIILEYKANPAEAILTSKEQPDIVIGPWLKGEKTRTKLVSVDYLFDELKISGKLFYKPLLDLGHINGRQYLLPVSFNLPAVIFSPEHRELIPGDFSLSIEQIREIGKTWNQKNDRTYTRMGFSPRWNPDFLYLTAKLFDARFEESNALFTYNAQALETGLNWIRSWSTEVNESIQAEDDFAFKYLYDPPYKLVTGSRNLFSYMSSEDLLAMPQDKLQNIDFRWITKSSMTPINDEIMYAAICRKAQNTEAAEAFLTWFFTERTQKELLERSRNLGEMERSFGISGGFSALRSVNEKVFPLFYPSILGHLPPAESLAVPRILPNNWIMLKEKIVMPWLVDAAGTPAQHSSTVKSMEARLVDWQKTR